jgi:cellobiose phosphorylase
MYRVGIENILGIRRSNDKLLFEPCIPNNWKEYSVKYTFKNTIYNIVVKNQNEVSIGVKQVILDSNIIEGNSIYLDDDNKNHNVEVIMI